MSPSSSERPEIRFRMKPEAYQELCRCAQQRGEEKPNRFAHDVLVAAVEEFLELKRNGGEEEVAATFEPDQLFQFAEEMYALTHRAVTTLLWNLGTIDEDKWPKDKVSAFVHEELRPDK